MLGLVPTRICGFYKLVRYLWPVEYNSWDRRVCDDYKSTGIGSLVRSKILFYWEVKINKFPRTHFWKVNACSCYTLSLYKLVLFFFVAGKVLSPTANRCTRWLKSTFHWNTEKKLSQLYKQEIRSYWNNEQTSETRRQLTRGISRKRDPNSRQRVWKCFITRFRETDVFSPT